jgi:type IV secretion system protein VirB8
MSGSLKQLIESGEYFEEAKRWYKTSYIHPFSQRSFLLIISVISLVVFFSILVNIYNLFPMKREVQYIINSADLTDKSVKIYKATYDERDVQLSITNILVNKYIIAREKYNYQDLKKQFTYVKNNSTRVIFQRFLSFMNIDNPESLILKYQKNVNRDVTIVASSYPDQNNAIVTIHTVAKDITGKKYEDKLWQIKLQFDIDQVDIDVASGQKFNFTVTNYETIMLKDNSKE